MGLPGAAMGDQVLATDTHIILVPTPGGAVPTALPHPFAGRISGGVSSTVLIEGKGAAVVGSTATNMPAHVPQGGSFQVPPKNSATIMQGSTTVLIDGKPAARNGDPANTCNDPADLPAGTVIATSTVLIG